ncbi:MAG: 6-carboxytetrahydropterin synthase [Candidatus Heimdallarchaeota archaeon]|nr:MAG: 6-carboxytetrahydropterin synthase [Candidatus Heimdallarchaeota archaeon]
MDHTLPSHSVAIDRVSAHFSAAHALKTSQYEEGLHGHNYQVEMEIGGKMDTEDLVVDFVFLEDLLQQILSQWDHYVLMPMNNTYVTLSENDDNLEIQYGNRFYSIPKREIKLLNCVNVTTEALSRLLGEKIRAQLKKENLWDRIQSIRITIWETSCYRATYSIGSTS